MKDNVLPFDVVDLRGETTDYRPRKPRKLKAEALPLDHPAVQAAIAVEQFYARRHRLDGPAPLVDALLWAGLDASQLDVDLLRARRNVVERSAGLWSWNRAGYNER